MHIALTVGRFDRLGGIERVTVEMALGYRALGHEVTVFATDWDERFADKFHFVRVGAPTRPAWLRTLRLPQATTQALKARRFDFVHGQGTSTLDCDLLTFHSVHAAWLEVSLASEPARSPRRLAKALYPFHRAAIAVERRQVRAHRGLIHACSRSVGEEVVHHYGAAPERVEAVPWGVDLEAFRPDADARARERERWGVGPDTPVLLFVANEFGRKGLDTVLAALARLSRQDATLVVVGRGAPEPYLPRLGALGLSGRVRFDGHREVAPAYQAADVFVFPSAYEGWGLVVPEALACGLPVVASRFPASSELVVPGHNGWLIDDPRDAQALAAHIERALTERPALASVARQSVMRCAWSEVCARLVELGVRSAELRASGPPTLP